MSDLYWLGLLLSPDLIHFEFESRVDPSGSQVVDVDFPEGEG